MEKAAFKIVVVRKADNETIVQFANVLRTKVVQCRNVHSKVKTKAIFIDGFPADIQSEIQMFQGYEQDAYLLKTPQDADTLLQKLLQKAKSERVIMNKIPGES